MSDFAVGDVVVCVDAGPSRYKISSSQARALAKLRQGAFYRISCIIEWGGESGFSFYELPVPPDVNGNPKGFISFRFRKLPKADEQFTAQMRACKPVRVRA